MSFDYSKIFDKKLWDKFTHILIFENVPFQDGIHMVSAPAKITVKDIQNSPPTFTGSLTGVISEDDPIGSLIMTVNAADGDTGAARKIQYKLLTSNKFLLLILNISRFIYILWNK